MIVRKIVAFVMAASLILLFASLSSAKDNSITVFGSYMPTFSGLEYERRLGAWGLGAEIGLLPISEAGGTARINLVGRYYLDLLSPVSPFLSISPGIILSYQLSSPEARAAALSLTASFFGYAAAGLQYQAGILRAAVEIGGGFDASPQVTETHGYFLFKGGIGIIF